MTYLQTSKLRNLFLLLSVLALVAVSCGTDSGTDGDATEATSAATEGTTAATAAPVSGGELIIAVTTQPNALDGVNSAERNASNVAQQIFDPLVWINDDLEFEPALAESWDGVRRRSYLHVQVA